MVTKTQKRRAQKKKCYEANKIRNRSLNVPDAAQLESISVCSDTQKSEIKPESSVSEGKGREQASPNKECPPSCCPKQACVCGLNFNSKLSNAYLSEKCTLVGLTCKESAPLSLEAGPGEKQDKRANTFPNKECFLNPLTKKGSQQPTLEDDSSEISDVQEPAPSSDGCALSSLTLQEQVQVENGVDSGEIPGKQKKAYSSEKCILVCLTSEEAAPPSLEAGPSEKQDKRASTFPNKEYFLNPLTEKGPWLPTLEADSSEISDVQERASSSEGYALSSLTAHQVVHFEYGVDFGEINGKQKKAYLPEKCVFRPATEKSAPLTVNVDACGMHHERADLLKAKECKSATFPEAEVLHATSKSVSCETRNKQEKVFPARKPESVVLNQEAALGMLSSKSDHGEALGHETEKTSVTATSMPLPLLYDRLVVGKPIADKYGKQSLCSLSIDQSSAGGNRNEVVAGESGRCKLPTRRSLFPDELATAGCDILENRFGDTVIFSVKRKSMPRVMKNSQSLDKECTPLSPARKRVMLAMQSSENSNAGVLVHGKHSTQTADQGGMCSTVFLLKRELSHCLKKNKAKRNSIQKSIFLSPFKKKLKLAKPKLSNKNCLKLQGKTNLSDESLLASSGTNSNSERCIQENGQDKVKSFDGSSVVPFTPKKFWQSVNKTGKRKSIRKPKVRRLYDKQKNASLLQTQNVRHPVHKKTGVMKAGNLLKCEGTLSGLNIECCDKTQKFATTKFHESSSPSVLTVSRQLETENGSKPEDMAELSFSDNEFSSSRIESQFVRTRTELRRLYDLDGSPQSLSAIHPPVSTSPAIADCHENLERETGVSQGNPFAHSVSGQPKGHMPKNLNNVEVTQKNNSIGPFTARTFKEPRQPAKKSVSEVKNQKGTTSDQKQGVPSAKLAGSKRLKVYKKQRYASLRKTEEQLQSKLRKRKCLPAPQTSIKGPTLEKELISKPRQKTRFDMLYGHRPSSLWIEPHGSSSSMRTSSKEPPQKQSGTDHPIPASNQNAFREEEPVSPVTGFMKRMGQAKEKLDTSIRVAPIELAEKERRAEEFTRTFNPTFKEFNNYSKGKLSKNVFQLKKNERTLRDKLARSFTCSPASKITQVKCLLKWCFVARKRLIARFQKTSDKLSGECANWLTSAKYYDSLSEKKEAMLGLPLHTSLTEPYFYDTVYEELTLKQARPQFYESACRQLMLKYKGQKTAKTAGKVLKRVKKKVHNKQNQVLLPTLISTEDGEVTEIFTDMKIRKNHYQWDCGLLCKTDDEKTVKMARKVFEKLENISVGRHMVFFLRKMNDCKNSCSLRDSGGHSGICRLANGNGAPMVVLQNLMPHFPRLRGVVRSLQNLKRTLRQIDELDSALYTGNRKELETIAEKAKFQGGEFAVGEVIYSNEDGIYKKYKSCFAVLHRKMDNLPRNYCFSCEILRPGKRLTKISRMRSKPATNMWEEICSKKSEKGVLPNFICDFCLKYIKEDKLPSVCTLNKMEVPELPKCIKKLNKFGKVFIQRAKAFQVVVKAGTVSGKNIPASHLNSKVVGRTFHLPLPLEETLERIVRDDEAVGLNQELYFLVRNLPTRQRTVWEHLVSKNEIFDALQWLKNHNFLYKKVKLPHKAEDLLKNLEDIPYDDPQHPPTMEDPNGSDNPDDLSCVTEDPKECDSHNKPKHLDDPIDNEVQPENFNLSADVNRHAKNIDDNSPHLCNKPAPNEDVYSEGERQTKSQNSAKLANGPRDVEAETAATHYSVDDADDSASDPNVQQQAPSVATIAAMLTQKNKDDPFYDDLTTVPVYDSRTNTLPIDMFQMLKVQSEALDSRAKHLDAKCFPALYPDGRNSFDEDRKVALQFSEFVKAKLMSRHPQFRLDKQYLFFLMNQLTNRQIAAGIYQALNITESKFTVSEFLDKGSREEVAQNMLNIFSKVRNTEQFWAVPRSQLYCMIENYGPATWFFTFSPSLYDDPDLDSYLREVNGEYAQGKTTSQLIAEDPVSVSRFCDQKLHGILDFLMASKDGPLGEVIHYAWRREYQGRGTQHFHLLLWVKNAPTMGIDSSEDIADFIQKHVTCAIPDKKTFPSLHEKVMKYQQHRDNSYCTRTKTTKSGKLPVCRFGFPRPVTDKLILRDVPTSVAGRRNLKGNARLYDLPRKENEVRTNDYNPAVLLAVGYGNMDIQFVGETSGIIVRYITKYVTKAEKSNINDVFDEISNTKNQYSKLWSIASRGLQERECHALEAADAALCIPLFGTDINTTIKYVSTKLYRNRKLKTKAQLERIAKENPKSTDLYCPSIIDNHYPNRPKEMEKVCLYDYVRHYDIVPTKPKREGTAYKNPSTSGYIHRRAKPCLVNHCVFNVKQKPEEYFYSLLLLYKPWRQIDDLKRTHKTFADAFAAEKDSLLNAMEHHDKRSKIAAAREEMLNLIEEKSKEYQAEEEDPNAKILKDPDGFIVGEAVEAMKEFREVAGLIDAEDLPSLEYKLNEDQERVYKYVQSALESDTPMRHFVSGVGGTGKSFLIKTIAKYVREKLKKDVAISSPTGLASFNIGGQTLHRLLSLRVQHGKDQPYYTLPDTVLNVLRLALKSTILLIVDEISMVSSIMLMFIHLRLTELFDTFKKENAFFGNLHILVLGDLLQLPPVAAPPPFKEIPEKIRKQFKSMSKFNMWKGLFTYDELRINMRQKTDPSFCKLLANVRLGYCSPKDVKTLLTRKLNFKGSTPEARTEELASLILEDSKAVCLLPTRKMCKHLNDAVLRLLPGKETVLVAQDSFDCRPSDKTRAKKKLEKLEDDCSRTGGLEKTIIIKDGARVMLLRNIDVTKGYVNGATGTIEKIIVRNGSVTNLHLKIHDNILELAPMTIRFDISTNVYVYRKGFPITLSYGITIHKSQGLSLDTCFVDVGSRVFAHGQTYVALSRVKTLNGLTVVNFDPEEITVDKDALKEYERLRLMTPHLKALAKEYRVKACNKNQHIEDDKWAPRLETGIILDQTPQVKKFNVSALLPAFENSDSVSCYANATLQCLFSYEPLRSALRSSVNDSALKQLADQYTKTRTGKLSASLVRLAASNVFTAFTAPRMQDAVEFFLNLVHISDPLKLMTTFTESYERKCKSCEALNVTSDLSNVLQMPTDYKKVSQFIQNRSSWSKLDNFECPNCHKKSEAVQRTLIKSPSNMFVVRILIWDPERKTKNNKFQMTALPSSMLDIDQSRYKLHAVVFHNGNGQIDCHHTAVVQLEKTFVLADDDDISECKWPRGSRGAYLLFYHRAAFLKPRSEEAAKPPTKRKTKAQAPVAVMHVLASPLPRSPSEQVRLEAPFGVNGRPPESKKPAKSVNVKYPNSRQPTKTLPNVNEESLSRITKRVPGFVNTDNSCYANASLQCLLSYEPLRSAASTSENAPALRKLATEYASAERKGVLLSSLNVRHEVDKQFTTGTQDDARLFVLSFISRHRTVFDKTEFTEQLEKKCDSCGAVRTVHESQTILRLPTVHSHRTISELLGDLSSYQPLLGYTCPNCGIQGTFQERSLVRFPNELLIIQLLLFDNVQKNHNFRVATDPIISIDGCRYQLHGGVFHHDRNAEIKDIHHPQYRAHYTAILNLGEQFVCANDATVQNAEWPAGSKDAYLLFYRRIE